MPKIQAATVAEHRAAVMARLVDAAEDRLRSGAELTAGAVASDAGIARNSIYRYVDSIDDLRSLVIDRHLPGWQARVSQSINIAPTPADRVVTWVEANLTEAAETGHGWLMTAVRSRPGGSALDEAAAAAHAGMRDSLITAWGSLVAIEGEQVGIAVELTQGILNAGFRELDRGCDPALVIEMSTTATRGLVAALAVD